VQHLSQKNPEAILPYYSIGKGASIVSFLFTIRVESGQLLSIIVHSGQTGGGVDNLIVNQERMICPPILLPKRIGLLSRKLFLGVVTHVHTKLIGGGNRSPVRENAAFHR